MVVDRGDAENAFAIEAIFVFGGFVDADLDHDAARFHHEHAAGDQKQHFLAGDDGDVANQAPQGQRARIAHKDRSGVGVVPEEPQTGAEHRGTENRHFRGGRDKGHVEKARPGLDADDPRHQQQHRGDLDHAPGSQAILAIGEIHRVTRAGHHQRHDNRVDRKRQRDRCNAKRQEQAMGGIDRLPGVGDIVARAAMAPHEAAEQHREGDLEGELLPGAKPVSASLATGASQLEPIVDSAERTKPHQRK